jgi:hypothetical protein
MIADSLRKIHISENREKITVQKLIYQEVNWFYGSKKMESYVWEILIWKYLILSPLTLTLPTPLKTSLPKTTKD